MRGEVTERRPLLDEQGRLTAPGWARDALWIWPGGHADPLRLKGWNRWIIRGGGMAYGLTLSDHIYQGGLEVWLSDPGSGTNVTARRRLTVPLGSTGLGETPDASAAASGEGWAAAWLTSGDGGLLTLHLDSFRDKEPLDAAFVLEPAKGRRIAAARSFVRQDQFYYTCKTCGIPAAGQVTVGEERILFDASSAVQDWSRGVLPYKSSWFWGSAWGEAEGVPFGFNLSSGLGDTLGSTENAVFLADGLQKLDRIAFRIPQKGQKEDLSGRWTAVSNDGRFKAVFQPEGMRQESQNMVVLKSSSEQMFGRFSGRVKLDSGHWTEFRDLSGFVERQKNQW